jgi:hypothetical protein
LEAGAGVLAADELDPQDDATTATAASRVGMATEPIRFLIVKGSALTLHLVGLTICAHRRFETDRLDRCVYGIQMNAKMKANAPIEPTSAWPMWIHVVIRSRMGRMLGSAARENRWRLQELFGGTLPAPEAHENPGR